MLSKIGTGELVVILLVALLIFGPSKLPALGKMAGKALGTIRRYTDTDNWADFTDDEDEEEEPVKPAKKKVAKKTQQVKEEVAEPEGDAEEEEASVEEAVEEEKADQQD